MPSLVMRASIRSVNHFHAAGLPKSITETLLSWASGSSHGPLRIHFESAPFAARIRDTRLALEVSVIQRLAEDLNARLLVRDPLCERVHHRKTELPGLFLSAFGRFLGGRLGPKRAP